MTLNRRQALKSTGPTVVASSLAKPAIAASRLEHTYLATPSRPV